ncbi:MAG: GH39 family glycosyl hydrolase [Actinomycetes bacterium]
MTAADAEARADWEARIGLRRGDGRRPDRVALPAPQGVCAAAGRAQVTLDWEPVDGAAGYLVHAADSPDGEFTPLDFGGGDVLAVPHPPYTDTTGEPGRPRWYAVAACPDVATVGPLSAPVRGTPAAEGMGRVQVDVDASTVTRVLPRPWRPMVGSEHLSHLLCADATGGRPVGEELTQALRLCHDELGVQAVRAHGILCDDLGVYGEDAHGRPVHDFSGVDRVYDHLLALGLRPVVELSFMPRALASDPSSTVFAYEAVISPPKDWDRWAGLVRALTAHLVERYGRAEVRDHWSFEVWNEANLEVFWSGTRAEFMRLYDVTVQAVRDVDDALVVGGPSSAAAGWVDELLTHVETSGAPLDFVSTHTYGAPPLDLRPVLGRHGREDARIWWTEWGTTPVHFNPVGDDTFGAAFLLRGMRSSAGRLEALSHWVASDHFEELGRPPALFHGGFGLLTVGNLRKPRYWALALAERLGDAELASIASGDGAGGMVECWAARDERGHVGVLVWNGTLDQSKRDGCSALDRDVVLRVDGLSAPAYEVRHLRVDAAHSNIRTVWRHMADGADWPTPEQWETLRAANTLDAYGVERRLTPEDGSVALRFALPMPGVSFVELVAVEG